MEEVSAYRFNQNHGDICEEGVKRCVNPHLHISFVALSSLGLPRLSSHHPTISVPCRQADLRDRGTASAAWRQANVIGSSAMLLEGV
jgi:hypothetical protein